MNTTDGTDIPYGKSSVRLTLQADCLAPRECPPVADEGQIQIDCFGRINGAGWHWAGEADIFEAIAQGISNRGR